MKTICPCQAGLLAIWPYGCPSSLSLLLVVHSPLLSVLRSKDFLSTSRPHQALFCLHVFLLILTPGQATFSRKPFPEHSVLLRARSYVPCKPLWMFFLRLPHMYFPHYNIELCGGRDIVGSEIFDCQMIE